MYGCFWCNQGQEEQAGLKILQVLRLKLIHWYQNDKYELYNIKEDISETNDLAGQMPEKVAELRKKLDVWLKETGAKMPVKNPDYKPEVKK